MRFRKEKEMVHQENINQDSEDILHENLQRDDDLEESGSDFQMEQTMLKRKKSKSKDKSEIVKNKETADTKSKMKKTKEKKIRDKKKSPENQIHIPEDSIIQLSDINKYYKTGGTEALHVLKDINLTVKKGEYLAILGPSGSGKSTLMNIIGCMDVMSDGEYFLDGEVIHKAREKELVKIRNEKIGFIFQKYHLISTYDVLQNIVMPLLMRGYTLSEAKEKSMDTITMLGLADRINHKPNELSGGQQQRVAIARALVGEPAILLADEPTGALDRKSGQEVLKLFQRLSDMGNTIVMITHDLSVAQHAKRMVRIVDGELFEDDVEETAAVV